MPEGVQLQPLERARLVCCANFLNREPALRNCLKAVFLRFSLLLAWTPNKQHDS